MAGENEGSKIDISLLAALFYDFTSAYPETPSLLDGD